MADMTDMEYVYLEDPAGNTLKALKFKGRLWPAFDPNTIRGVETMPARDGDVIIVAYPKSGTHWVWEIVRLLQAGTTDVPLVEKDVAMIEDVMHDQLEQMPSPRALNTHAHFELMPKEVVDGSRKCKLIYVTRDPRDLAVSYFNHHKKLVQYYEYQGQWKDYLPLFLKGLVDYESWFAYTRGWEQAMKDHPELDVHVTSYEALHQNTKQEIERIAAFMGVTRDSAFLDQVVRKASFDHMRDTKGKAEMFLGNADPVMYRKGKVGDWKNWFTVAQSEQFNQMFEAEMAGTRAHELYSHTNKQNRGADDNMNGI